MMKTSQILINMAVSVGIYGLKLWSEFMEPAQYRLYSETKAHPGVDNADD